MKRKRIGRDIFYRGTKGGIRSIKNPVYKVTLYELLKAYSLVKTQSIFQKIDIPKLPVMTTQEGIKQIKDNMQLIDDWKKIHELIPESFNKTLKSKKSGLASIFTACLELTKDGIINIMQENLFGDVLIKKSAHTPLRLKRNKKMEKNNKNNIINFPNKKSKLEKEIEAIIFAAEEPLDIETIEERVGTRTNIKKILENLQKEYTGRGINLVCISNKWIFRTALDVSKLMSLQKSSQRKLSKATIETLSIIVYHQPVTRSEIEEIRGVAFASNTLEILLELDWVKPAGRKNVPGKPIQYATTENFLNHFNIKKLSDLPTIDELSSAGLIDAGSVDSSIFGTGKFFKEQSQDKKDNIYSDVDDVLKQTTNIEE